MTSLTRGLCVRTAKWETGSLSMIELGFLPVRLQVARLAGASKAPLMDILNRMTIIAGCRKVLVYLTEMTTPANDIPVLAAQLKFRPGVIECYPVVPSCRAVARLAFPPQVALVRLISHVTSETCVCGISPALALEVTVGALQLPVCASQRKICRGMIKERCIERHDIGVASHMISVTVAT